MRTKSRFRIVVLGVALAATIAGEAPAVPPPYPATPPDLAHPDRPHEPLFSVSRGRWPSTIPVLVAAIRFGDQPAPANLDSAAEVAARFFGARPSVRDYFLTASDSRFRLGPARETQGAANDGVVEVTAPTRAGFVTGTAGGEIAAALRLIDPLVDFASYDANDDGIIRETELTFIMMRTSNPMNDNGGAVRGPGQDGWPASYERIDDKWIRFAGGTVGTATNLMTIVHEIAHLVLHLPDFYGFGVGQMALSGPTIDTRELAFEPTAYERMHWGWLTPRVIMRDGYVTLQRGEAAVLYDAGLVPSDGRPTEYFLAEPRPLAPGRYDANAPDAGLVIWRVADSRSFGGAEWPRPITLQRTDGIRIIGCSDTDIDGLTDEDGSNGRGERAQPGVDDDRDGRIDEDPVGPDGCYGGSSADAWPGDAAPRARTAVDGWVEGGARRTLNPIDVAIRSIWPPASDGSVRAFYDARGPGVMVDTFDLTVPPRTVYPGDAVRFDVPIMNTQDAGEPSDTFRVTISGPRPWGSATTLRALAARSSATVPISIRVPTDEPRGPVDLTVSAESIANPSIRSESPLRVEVMSRELTPDRLEPNNLPSLASQIPLDTHVHAGHDGRRIIERWTGRIPGLNLHDRFDTDHFRFRIPDFRAPDQGGHTEFATYPECGYSEIDFGSIVTSSSVTVSMSPPPRNGLDEPVQITSIPGQPERPVSTTLSCPATEMAERGLTQLTARIGERVVSRSSFPPYDAQVTYQFERRVIPDDSIRWIGDLIAASGKRSLIIPPCGGGFFPGCAANSADKRFSLPATTLSLAHPMNRPAAACEQQGCSDFVPFWWPGGRSFDLIMPAGFTLSLRDRNGITIAEAGGFDPPVDAPLDPEPDDVRMTVPLDPGFYLLSIDGPVGETTMTFAPPPSGADLSVTAEPEPVFEPGGSSPVEMQIANNTAEPVTIQSVTWATPGSAPESACDPGDLDPGETAECEFAILLSGAPGQVPVTIQARGKTPDGELIEEQATILAEILDAPPSLHISRQDAVVAHEPVVVVVSEIAITNDGPDPATITSLQDEVWSDTDGDRDRDEGEMTSVDLGTGLVQDGAVLALNSCAPLTTVAPGVTITCKTVLQLGGQTPWSDPEVTTYAVAHDDEGTQAVSSAQSHVDVTATLPRSATAEVGALDLFPTFAEQDTMAGRETVETGLADLAGTLTIRNATPGSLPVLIDTIRFAVGFSSDAKLPLPSDACTADATLPMLVQAEAKVRFVCRMEEEVELGEIRVTAEIGVR